MVGSILQQLLQERQLSVRELSRLAQVPAQTLYSIIKRDSVKVNPELLQRLSQALQVPVQRFYPALDEPAPVPHPSEEEWELLHRYRNLDAPGRRVIRAVLEAESARLEDPAPPRQRLIPLYATPAAAGYASPVEGEDFVLHSVPEDSPADFAARISGQSMEPWIADGSIVLVTRRSGLADGDIGLFFVDGDMLCKQYCRDMVGAVHLFSLNRAYADADRHIPPDSSSTLCCYGKVLLPRRPPLP